MESQAAGGTSRWLAVVAIGVTTLLTLAGCGGSGDQTSTSADETAAANPTASTTAGSAGPDGERTDPVEASGQRPTDDAVEATEGVTAEEPVEADAVVIEIDPDGADGDEVGPDGADGDEVDPDGADGDEDGTNEGGSATSDGAGAGGQDRSIPTTTVTTTNPGAPAGPEPEDVVASRYEAFWQAFGQARANPTSDPSADVPILADLATGEQLEQAHSELIGLAERGEALRPPSTPAVAGLDNDAAHRIRVDSLDDAAAELTVCFVNDRISYRVADGAIISDAVVTVTAKATMARTDGTWKLVRSRAVALDPGVAGCWLEAVSRYPW
jgi:hypothetical protein